jgi:hypothetical protein
MILRIISTPLCHNEPEGVKELLRKEPSLPPQQGGCKTQAIEAAAQPVPHHCILTRGKGGFNVEEEISTSLEWL